MRILLVTSDFPPRRGGIGAVAYNLQTDLLATGHLVHTLNFDGSIKNYRRLHLRDFFYTAATKNEYYRLGRILNPRLFVRPRGYRDFVYANLIYRVSHITTRNFRPDIVHILKADLYTAIYNISVPSVVTCHSEEIRDTLPVTYSLRSATRIHCVSQYAQKSALRVAPRQRDRMTIIYNAVDLRARPSDTMPAARTTLVSIGRLVKAKNFESIIRAYGLLSACLRAEHKLIIIGSGPEERSLTKLIASLQLDNCVDLRGNVSDLEKLMLLEHAKIFVLCPTRYKNEEEGFGIVYIEAQANGVPVIGSKTGGAPEAIGNGGLLVANELDTSEIAATMERLLTDEKVYEELRQLAEANVKRFDRSLWVRHFEDLYRGAVDDGMSGGGEDIV